MIRYRSMQVAVLYDQASVAIAASGVAATILIGLCWSMASHGLLLGWLSIILLVSSVRIQLIRKYRQSMDKQARPNYWLAWFVAGVVVSGVLWVSITLMLDPEDNRLQLGLAVLWVCGMTAGSVATLSVVKGAFFAFAIPALLPNAFYLLSLDDGVATAVGGGEILFFLFISLSALRMHRSLVNGFELQLHNKRLIKRLDAEKATVERLNQQLEQRVAERTAELAEINTHLQRDIAKREQVEKALFAEKVKAQVTLHSIADAVITTDADGLVEYLNPVAEKLTDWTLQDAQGVDLQRVFHFVQEQDREPIIVSGAHLLQNGNAASLERHGILLSREDREHAVQVAASPILDPEARVSGLVLVFSDVTEARRMAQKLSHQASHDALTELVNRREFEHRLQRLLDTNGREGDEHVLCYLDLDQFKVINDTCGHVAGDELLRQLADMLQKQIRGRDTLARLGGDEFGILMEHCSVTQAERVTHKLLSAIRQYRFVWEGRSFNIGASIGLVPIFTHGINLSQVLRAADSACYAAKEAGRNRIHIYQEADGLQDQRHSDMQWVTRIYDALERDAFLFYLQPVVALSGAATEEAFHCELLVRLQDESGQTVLPGVFLPVAERYNLATKIDYWVVRNAFRWLAGESSDAQRITTCFINLSGQSIADEAFLGFVVEQLQRHSIPASRICFEIAETVAVANLSNITRFIIALKTQGCRFSLDHFGSGLSSFTYLKNLPVDFLKIDGSFIRGIVEGPVDLVMVKSICEMGRVMGKQIVAECVEDRAILEKLQTLEIDYVQGNGIAPPGPLAELR